ncbi:MAG TPA: acyltransferase [Mucilaginibacter sp.]|nr:acyltransferase [Mucilaginibacter sp.]
MRIKHVDVLRGIAAILVTFFHLTGGIALSEQTASYGKYGYLGVELFFVISGFILPFSMYKTHYTQHNFWRFILKRVIRIYPAYVAVMLLGILLPYFTGRTVLPLLPTLTHFVFLNSILRLNWISPVFWTLAIEFQYYLLIGVLFKFLNKSNLGSALFIFSIVMLSIFLKNDAYIFHWFGFFGLGILIYNRRFTDMPLKLFWTSFIILTTAIVFVNGIPEAIAGCFAFLFIMYAKFDKRNMFNAVALWLGAISYSLYLVHWEIGRSAIVFARHLAFINSSEMLRVAFGTLFSILAAGILYKLIEQPSMRLSSKIKYKKDTIPTQPQLVEQAAS